MTPELAVLERLVATGAVTAIVPVLRITDIILPQSTAVPAIRAHIVADPVEYHLRGTVGLGKSIVQVDCYVAGDAISDSDDPGANLAALSAAIDDALSGKSWYAGTPAAIRVTGAFRVNRRENREPDELRQIWCQQDYRVVWKLL